ncbi:ribonucleotide reductase inhibitor-domain-containing protein [Phyllosticta citrichinensis]|uniref:Ribonucleotide reductase inhibitor-domain-containing protein n=1 Tax=Phyllosticta citrichinensis TaxID=1130410 RepID=A0ABR1Y723_9PEZI
MSPSQHRSKRPFQPSITTFFARSDRSDIDTTASPSHSPPHQQGIQVLPPNIQASLLNVGMRVRKAIPEGYQTHTKKMAPAFTSTTRPPTELNHNRQAELLPFCGLHKTGGLALQPSPIIVSTASAAASSNSAHASTNDAQPLGAHEPIFDPAHFSFSSDSNASIFSTDSLHAPPTTNKRRYIDDDDSSSDADDESELAGNNATNASARPLFPNINTDFAVDAFARDDVQVSPRTKYPVSHTVMPDLSGGLMRPLARPRTRKRDAMSGGRAGRRHAIDSGAVDFEEADFLRPCEWREDKEIEMGGV